MAPSSGSGDSSASGSPRHSRMEGGPVSMMPAMATLNVKAFGADTEVRMQKIWYISVFEFV